jgi:hypothetical protein
MLKPMLKPMGTPLLKPALSCLCLAACAGAFQLAGALATAPVAHAQTPSSDPAGPVPPAILRAKKLFVSNAGSDSGLFPEPFSGDPNRPYTEFYNALKATGRYQLVDGPALADLVLEVRLLAPAGPQVPNKVNGASDPLPMLRLVVYDRETHYVLWAITESVEEAVLQKTHDRNLDLAIDATVRDFEQVSGVPAPPAPPTTP